MPSGSCLCKALQYEYSGEPVSKAVCHCLTCRKFSSASSVNLLVPQDHFHLVKGTPKGYHQTHESGMHMTLHFCGNCGSLLYKTADRKEFEGGVIVLAGTLDDPRALDDAKPEAEFFVKHRASWWPALADAKQLQEFD
ncbi:hypothetical protein Asppvi_004444 [Aspergillus pseudoviridinutans]|uniref:CENP-V/GFA domain-containing protein n=1 Tax=Aspergillus pseudoviridinutans TaxID=1517512 RepID=A0A9P3EUA4_9EURO|nr:uncharacterized protein Asppvi_004444 [Aspergillus pseudoviridinutans]GIJ85585.1 hypothetical protein Asppvi_004444 [Aspergillus pseudoviridinutans]